MYMCEYDELLVSWLVYIYTYLQHRKIDCHLMTTTILYRHSRMRLDRLELTKKINFFKNNMRNHNQNIRMYYT
jgi:hypothetical protein